MHTDVLYFITCHENPEVVLDLLSNIEYYHKTLSFHVILHSNTSMITELSDKLPSFATLHPTPCAKSRFTYSLYHALIECFVFARELEIISTYCITLASNCMFHREVTLDLLKDFALPRIYPVLYPDDAHVQIAMSNTDLVTTFADNNVDTFYFCMHEGALIEYETFSKIADFTLTHNLHEKIQNEICFEELLLPSLYVHYMGHLYSNINTFPTRGNDVPTISQIESSTEPCFKPCPRDIDHPLRVWLRSKQHVNVDILTDPSDRQ
jgi:hypothetical protein